MLTQCQNNCTQLDSNHGPQAPSYFVSLESLRTTSSYHTTESRVAESMLTNSARPPLPMNHQATPGCRPQVLPVTAARTATHTAFGIAEILEEVLSYLSVRRYG